MEKKLLENSFNIRKFFISEYMRGDFFEGFISEKDVDALVSEGSYRPSIFVKKKILCSLTKHSRAYSNLLGFSRFYAKKFSESGVLPGVTKSS